MSGAGLFRSAAGAVAVRDAYRRLIEEFLPTAEQRTLPTCLGDTFVLSAGPTSAPAVLLLHGSGSVAGAWAPELVELARTRRVHAVDLPGESGFSAPVRPPLVPGTYARWLSEVAESLRAAPAAVVGTSLGGWVALDLASTFPDVVTELVLFSPSGIGRRRVGPLLLAGLLGVTGDAGRRRALAHLLGPAAAAWDDEFHRALGALALLTFRHFRPRTDSIPVLSDERLQRLPTRLTAVFGAQDRLLHAGEAARRLRRLHPRGHVVLLPDQGHLVPDQLHHLRHLVLRPSPPTAGPAS